MTDIQAKLFVSDTPSLGCCAECDGPITMTGHSNPAGEVVCEDCYDDNDYYECPNCKKVVDETETITNPDGDEWCEECHSDATFYCEKCSESIWTEDMVEVTVSPDYRSHTEYMCEGCADDVTFTCDDCNTRTHTDSQECTHDGRSICRSCYENGYFYCEGCDQVFHTDDYADDGFCVHCRPHGEDFAPSGFRDRLGCITEIGSARCYGIELETDECDRYTDLVDSGAWGAKDDCTVRGKEFYSDILSGDAGLAAVREWGDLASDNGWEASSSAGYHLHLDMRTESADSLYAIAYAFHITQDVWFSFVERHRHNGSYSHSNRYTCADINGAATRGTRFDAFARGMDRYNWMNLQAYNCHATFENRLHQGTCDDTEVINWVKANTRFADWASAKGLDGVKEALDGKSNDEKFIVMMNEAWQDYPLSDYYANKARRYDHGNLACCSSSTV